MFDINKIKKIIKFYQINKLNKMKCWIVLIPNDHLRCAILDFLNYYYWTNWHGKHTLSQIITHWKQKKSEQQ